jgi:CRISPR/Cas system-associated protein Cas5 (RAMP superfamily)
VIYVVKDSDQARIIASAAHSIIRIGGSHGLASVEEVKTGLLSCGVTNDEVITRYSFWNDLVLNALPTDILVQDVVDYRRTSIGNYMGAPLRRRAYPYSKTLMSPMEVNVKIDSRRAMVCMEGEEVLVIER